MLKPLTVWITTKCVKNSSSNVNTRPRYLFPEKSLDVSRSNRILHGTTDCLKTGKGVRQGCILSSCLINLYAEYIMQTSGLD